MIRLEKSKLISQILFSYFLTRFLPPKFPINDACRLEYKIFSFFFSANLDIDSKMGTSGNEARKALSTKFSTNEAFYYWNLRTEFQYCR